ncbi:universal stress protein [Thalassorhabdus alkalitolerans]|uniref:Universal stress protein n=1 Tax=Thalassorhabdus alkalitolerans TaxID=2282697 RepID=A0ABW0YNA2_9BACI
MTLQYKNVLVAVDGSEGAKHAFEKALKISKKSKARLIISHVVDLRSFSRIEPYSPNFTNWIEDTGQQLLNQYKKEAVESGIENVETSLDFGSPKVMLGREIADKWQADLIVVGATGLGAVERFVIGSVSEQVARNAKRDVLIVRR